MRWYVGGVAEAVATSKSKNAIFVVYIEGRIQKCIFLLFIWRIYFILGQDEKSKILTTLINEEEVSNKLELEQFVALKLEAGSQHHRQFAELCILYNFNFSTIFTIIMMYIYIT